MSTARIRTTIAASVGGVLLVGLLSACNPSVQTFEDQAQRRLRDGNDWVCEEKGSTRTGNTYESRGDCVSRARNLRLFYRSIYSGNGGEKYRVTFQNVGPGGSSRICTGEGNSGTHVWRVLSCS